MKKNKMKILMIASGLICLASAVLAAGGAIDQIVMVAALIIFFPLFVVSTFLTWKASDREGDYPFIGY
jgi:hypothetical protein